MGKKSEMRYISGSIHISKLRKSEGSQHMADSVRVSEQMASSYRLSHLDLVDLDPHESMLELLVENECVIFVDIFALSTKAV